MSACEVRFSFCEAASGRDCGARVARLASDAARIRLGREVPTPEAQELNRASNFSWMPPNAPLESKATMLPGVTFGAR
jgi:hypothetical protein